MASLSFTFDEYILSSPVNSSTVSIVNADDGSLIVTLDGDTTLNTTVNGRIIELILLPRDLSTIISSGVEELALNITEGLVRDFLIQASPMVDGIVPTLTEDMTPPDLIEWTINMDNGLIKLTFSESISAMSLNLTKVTLQDGQVASTSFEIATAEVSSANTVLTIGLSTDDLLRLKGLGNIGLDGDNTYVHLEDWCTHRCEK